MSCTDFQQALKSEYVLVDVICVKAQEFLHLTKRNMSIKGFSTKLNSLPKYVHGATNSERGRLDVFMGELRPNIAKDVMMRDNPPKSLSDAFGQTLRSKTMRQHVARDRGPRALVSLLVLYTFL